MIPGFALPSSDTVGARGRWAIPIRHASCPFLLRRSLHTCSHAIPSADTAKRRDFACNRASWPSGACSTALRGHSAKHGARHLPPLFMKAQHQSVQIQLLATATHWPSLPAHRRRCRRRPSAAARLQARGAVALPRQPQPRQGVCGVGLARGPEAVALAEGLEEALEPEGGVGVEARVEVGDHLRAAGAAWGSACNVREWCFPSCEDCTRRRQHNREKESAQAAAQPANSRGQGRAGALTGALCQRSALRSASICRRATFLRGAGDSMEVGFSYAKPLTTSVNPERE